MTDIKLIKKEASRNDFYTKNRVVCSDAGVGIRWGSDVLCTIGCSIIQERPHEVGPATQDWVIQDRSNPRDRSQAVGPATQDRDNQDRTVQQERMGDRTIVKERVVERRREGEVYVGGFGGFTWGHDYDNAEGTGSLKGAPIGSLG